MSRGWAGGSTSRWRRFRLTILARDHYLCQIRGPKCTDAADQVDHIVPLSQGGQKYVATNCRAACRACNLGRRTAVAEEPPPRHVSRW